MVKSSHLLNASGNLVVSPTQKAKVIAAVCAAAHNNEKLGDSENSTTVAIHKIRGASSPVVNPEEVKSIIRTLKIQKSPGQVSDRNTCLKHLTGKSIGRFYQSLLRVPNLRLLPDRMGTCRHDRHYKGKDTYQQSR